MTERLVIVGCGGHGREIASIALAVGVVPEPADIQFIDDSPAPESLKKLHSLGHAFIGSTQNLNQVARTTEVLIGIADGIVRHRMADIASDCGMVPLILVHPDATIAPGCSIAPGSIVWPGARISTHVSLGRHVHVNQNATIGHDASVEDFVTINPLAAVSGSVRLGSHSLVGAGAVVLQGRTVGRSATVGASACVVRDVPDSTTVVGVPALPRQALSPRLKPNSKVPDGSHDHKKA